MALVSTGQISIVDVNDGLSASLTNNSVTLPADKDGVITSYDGADTAFSIYEAGYDTSSTWTYYVSAISAGLAYRDINDTADRTATGATNGILDTNYLKITSLTSALGYVDIVATKQGQNNIMRRFSVAKATTGATGIRGTVTVVRAISGTSWSDSEATAAVTGAITSGTPTTPIKGDIATLTNTASAYSETRVYSGTAWVTVGAYIAGSQIVNNSINADKLTVNSVSADKVQANAITASKIVISDTSNIVKNPVFGTNLTPSLEGWANITTPIQSQGNITAMLASDASVPAGAPAATVLRVTIATSISDLTLPYIDVVPGETYYYEMWMATSSDATMANGASLQHTFLDRQGNNASYPGTSGVAGFPNGLSTPNTTWTKHVATATVPATVANGAVTGRLIVRPSVRNYTGGTPAGYVYITKVVVRKMVMGELIVDGAITAAKITSQTITGDKIAGNTIEASSIKSNSITTGQIAVGTLSQNLAWNGSPDSNDIGAEGWYTHEGINVANAFVVSATSITGMGSKRFNFARPAGLAAIACKPFRVTPGATYAIKFISGASEATTNGRYIRIAALKNLPADGLILSSNRTTFTDLVSGNSAWSVGPTNEAYNWTCPANVEFATLAIYNTNAGPANLYLDNFEVRSSEGAVVIAPGSITASEMVARTITANQIAARSITANEITARSITATEMTARTLTANEIATGTLTANEIAANTITGQKIAGTTITAANIQSGTIGATQIAANAITASKLTITDFTNYVGNGDMYLGNANWNSPYVVEDTTNAWNGGKYVWARPAFTDSTPQYYAHETKWTVEAGEEYWLEWYGKATSDVNGLCRVYVRVNNQAGGQLITLGSGDLTSAATGWTKFAAKIVMPANANHAMINIVTQHSVGTHYVGAIYVRRRSGGELIVDGSITANHMTVNSINANSIQSNAVTTAKIAAGAVTADQIASNSVTTNKLTAVTRPFSTIGLNMRIDADGVLRWDAGTVTWVKNDGTIATRNVSAGGRNWTGKTTWFFRYIGDDAVDGGLDPQEGYNNLGNHPLYRLVAQWNGGSDLQIMAGVGTSINGDRIVTGTLDANKIKANSIEGDRIKGNTITGDKIVANQISANKLLIASRPITTVGFNFRVNNDGKVEWDSGSVKIIGDDGNILSYDSLSNGSTSTYPGNQVYILYFPGRNYIDWTQDAQYWNDQNFVKLATWKGGSDLTAYAGVATMINGNNIVTGSIDADRIKARTIDAGNIKVGTLTGTEIASKTIKAENIAANTITATEIAGTTITGDKLVAGTIGAAQIAAGAIVASKLSVTNNDNIIADGDYRDRDTWGLGADTRFELFSTTQAWLYFRRGLRFAPGGDMGNRQSTWFPVEAGATYKIKVSTYVGPNFNTTDGWFNPVLHIPNVMYMDLKTFQSTPNNNPTVKHANSWTTTTGAGTVDTKDFIYTVPSNVKEMQFRYTGNILGDTVEQAVSIVRVSDATLIADGAITTDKITVNTLNGDRILAGTLDANKIKANTILSNTITVSGVTGSNTIADAFKRAEWTTVSGTGKPADNATVGATWSTNVSGRPTNLSGLTGTESIKNTEQTWGDISGNGKPETYTVMARSNATPTNTLPSNYAHGMRGSSNNVFVDTYNSGLRSDSYARSYTVMWRVSSTYWGVRHFDVYGDGQVQYANPDNRHGVAGMVAQINSLAAGTPVVIYTSDEANRNHLNGGLPAAIYDLGGSRTEFGASTFAGNTSYILIGMKGAGEGNGVELRCGATAYLMTSFSIVNGIPMFGGKTLKDAQDVSFSDGRSVNVLNTVEAGATVGAPAGTKINNVDVATITSAVSAITDDNVVSPAEKTALYNQYQEVISSENKVYLRLTDYENAGKGSRYDATTKRNNMTSAKDSLVATVAGIFNDMSNPTNVNGALVRQLFTTYYDRYNIALTALQYLAAESADFDQVTGNTKPENNATKGAPTGTLVGGTDAGTVANNANNAANLALYDSNAGGYTIYNNQVVKTGDRGNFYGNVYSQEFGNGSARVTGKLRDKDTFIGLTDGRETAGNSAYNVLDYAWHYSGGSNNWQIWESGNVQWSGTSFNGTNFSSGNMFNIEYDGATVKYYCDNLLVRTVTNPGVNRVFYVGVNCGPNNAAVTNINLQVIADNSLAKADPAARINQATTTIDPGKILIQGGTTLDSWRDQTEIRGGAIKTNSITAAKLTLTSRGITVQGMDFSYNRTTGKLDMTDGYVFFTNDAGQPQASYMNANSFAYQGNATLIYCYPKGTDRNTYAGLNNSAAIYGDTNCLLLCIWTAGINFSANYGGTIIDGDRITTNSINANRIQVNTITASQIASNTITTNEIAANTITASNIKAGAINATSLAVGGNTEGLVYNGGAETGTTDGWVGSGFVIAGGNGSQFNHGVPTQNQGGGNGYFSKAFPVIAGRDYTALWDLYGTNGYFRVMWSDTKPDFNVNTNNYVDLLNNGGSGNSWQSFSNGFTAPANAKWVSIVLYNTGTGSYNYWDNIQFFERVTGVRIKDGTITATQIKANSISADRLSVTSLSSITANIGTVTAGLIKSADGATSLNLDNGRQTFTKNSYRMVEGAGIGPNANMVLWFGPTSVGEGSETVSNSRFALGTDGKVYYGASEISNGRTVQSAQYGQAITVTLAPGEQITLDAAVAVENVTQSGTFRAQIYGGLGSAQDLIAQGPGSFVARSEPGTDTVTYTYQNTGDRRLTFTFKTIASNLFGGNPNYGQSYLRA